MPRTPIEYRDASAQVRAVFDDIKRTRQVDDVNNFWKYLAHDPALLARTWASDRDAVTVRHPIGLVRHADDTRQLAEHRALPAIRRRQGRPE
jgi:hypothetical protein